MLSKIQECKPSKLEHPSWGRQPSQNPSCKFVVHRGLVVVSQLEIMAKIVKPPLAKIPGCATGPAYYNRQR